MKKILVALALLVVTSTTLAQHHGHGFRHGGHYRGPGVGWWVAPIVTGVIGYEIARNQQQVIVQQPPIIIQQQPMLGVNCTEWKEIQTSDGRTYRERTCTQ